MRQFRMRCATWNIHRAKGQDGRVDPDRIHRAISTEIMVGGLDLLALQEADEECRPHAGLLDVDFIENETGLTYLNRSDGLRWGPESHGFLGTILFLHPRFSIVHHHVLDLPGHCHRGAVSVEACHDDVPVRIMSMHLSLTQPLRIVQMRIVGQYLRRRPQMQTVLLGDLNEWRPWGGLILHPRLLGRRFRGPWRATFPSFWPCLPLDRILTDCKDAITDINVLKSPALRIASDHAPLAATIKITPVCE